MRVEFVERERERGGWSFVSLARAPVPLNSTPIHSRRRALLYIYFNDDIMDTFSKIEMTIMYWKKDMDILNDATDMIVYGDEGDLIKCITPNKNGGVEFEVSNNNQTIQLKTDDGKILTNTWNLYAFVIKYSKLVTTLEIFVNSILSAEKTINNFVPFENMSLNKAYLGNDPRTNSDISPSIIEDFRIYNKALKDYDIYRIYIRLWEIL